MMFGGVKQRQDGDDAAILLYREEIFERAGYGASSIYFEVLRWFRGDYTSGNMVGSKTHHNAKSMSTILPLFALQRCVYFTKQKLTPYSIKIREFPLVSLKHTI